jgi:erythronate-4-phosphate dehydrogenase
MIIALDNALPYWEGAFAGLGEIRRFDGRNLHPEEIHDADALVVRSVTNVNAGLLEGSSVRFVATASAGIDNLDSEYLQRSGIHFSHSAGCNAEAVSEYVLTALYIIADRRSWDLKDKSLAIIGVGNIGSRVEKKARAQGMQVFLCDPPLRDSTGDTRYRDFDEAVGADILTFHVPLVTEGPYPTWHMIDRRALDRLAPTQFLLNTARGAVFDDAAVRTALADKKIAGAVLDVWEGEPEIDYELLTLADIGTPHIAGFGIDGKIRATEMAREELCRFFQIQSSWDVGPLLPEPVVVCPERGRTGRQAILSVLLQAFRILDFHSKLKDIGPGQPERLAETFDILRNRQPLRAEFRHYIVKLTGQNTILAEDFKALGFKVKVATSDL